jgi:hypothetical protein
MPKPQLANYIKFPAADVGDTKLENPNNIKPSDLIAVAGNTPYGRYDSDPDFITDAKHFAIWAARRLGWPTVSIEIDEYDFYAALEEATDEFSRLVNNQNIEDNLGSLLGNPRDVNYTGRYINSSPVAQMVLLATNYGSQVGAGGDVKWRKDFIQTAPGKQVYDVKKLFKENNDTDREIIIKRVFHYEIPASVFYFYPFSGTSTFGVGDFGSGFFSSGLASGSFAVEPAYSYSLYPLYDTLLSIQEYELHDMIRRSEYSFEVVGGRVKLFPVPRHRFNLWFEYVYRDEALSVDAIGAPSVLREGSLPEGEEELVVSDYSNAPYDYISYTFINSSGKRWIYRYALAIAKHKLGMVRTKFSEVPSPLDNFRLNGDQLKTEAQQEIESLRQTLVEQLDQLSHSEIMRKRTEEAQQLQQFLQHVPMKIYTD